MASGHPDRIAARADTNPAAAGSRDGLTVGEQPDSTERISIPILWRSSCEHAPWELAASITE
jgi:hypothetical protein